MSKRSRAERKAVSSPAAGKPLVTVFAGNAAAAAPERPRDHILHRQLGADPRTMEQRAVWLTRRELVDLIKLVEHHRTTHPLLPYLKQIRDNFDDRVRQLRELEATAVALGFWLDGEQANINGVIGKMKRGRKKGEKEAHPKKGHRKLESMIACPTVEEMKATLAEAEAAKNGTSDIVVRVCPASEAQK